MKSPQCPNCKSTNLAIENQPNGGAHCLSCGWLGKYSLCFHSSLKTISDVTKHVEVLLARAKTAEIDVHNHMARLMALGSIATLETLLQWIAQENNLDGVADD